MAAEHFDPSQEPDAATSSEQDIREIAHSETPQQPAHRPALDQSGLDAQRLLADLPPDDMELLTGIDQDAQAPQPPSHSA